MRNMYFSFPGPMGDETFAELSEFIRPFWAQEPFPGPPLRIPCADGLPVIIGAKTENAIFQSRGYGSALFVAASLFLLSRSEKASFVMDYDASYLGYNLSALETANREAFSNFVPIMKDQIRFPAASHNVIASLWLYLAEEKGLDVRGRLSLRTGPTPFSLCGREEGMAWNIFVSKGFPFVVKVRTRKEDCLVCVFAENEDAAVTKAIDIERSVLYRRNSSAELASIVECPSGLQSNIIALDGFMEAMKKDMVSPILGNPLAEACRQVVRGEISMKEGMPEGVFYRELDLCDERTLPEIGLLPGKHERSANPEAYQREAPGLPEDEKSGPEM